VRLPQRFAPALRQGTPCVVGRIEKGYCLLDLRCVLPADDHVLHRAINEAAACEGVDACTS
jgi:L-seryl-tRNA(Ser) seleniumtransferase